MQLLDDPAGPIPAHALPSVCGAEDRHVGQQDPFQRLDASRRIDLGDPAKAIGFGLMRPRNKCSAHFCAVPARYDTEPERLFRFDVTRRKILHEACFQESARSSIERWVKLSVVRRTTLGSALIREPGKVGKYGRDQIAMMGVGRSQAGGV